MRPFSSTLALAAVFVNLLALPSSLWAARSSQCSLLVANPKAFTSWQKEAQAFVEALNERKPARFSASVEGLSLIPPKILERLNEHLKTTTYDSRAGRSKTVQHSLKKIEAIELETWNDDEFVIAIHYQSSEDREKRVLGTFSNEYRIWRDYIKKAIEGREPYAIEGNKLPQEAPKRPDRFEPVLTNRFNTVRTLAEYNSYFKGILRKVMREYGDSSDWTWTDMGAGMAYAHLSWIREWARKYPDSPFPKLVSVGYKYPDENTEPLEAATKQTRGKFKYLEGKQTPANIGRMKTDLITDVMGIYTYSDTPAAVLKAYVKALNRGGTLLLFTYSLDAESAEWIESQRANLIFAELENGTYLIRKK